MPSRADLRPVPANRGAERGQRVVRLEWPPQLDQRLGAERAEQDDARLGRVEGLLHVPRRREQGHRVRLGLGDHRPGDRGREQPGPGADERGPLRGRGRVRLGLAQSPRAARVWQASPCNSA